MFVEKMMLQDDYRDFAEKYLGVDYEDYIQLLYDVKPQVEESKTEYELTYC